MQTKLIERYFFFGLLLATLVFSFMIFQPFLAIIIIAACFAVILYPLYNWLQGKGLPAWASSLLTLLFFIVVICGPLFGIIALVFDQTQDLYYSIVGSGNAWTFLESAERRINQVMPQGIEFDAEARIADFVGFLSSNLASLFTATLTTIFGFFLICVSLFFFLKDGARWREGLVLLSPLADKDDNKIINRLSMAVNGIIKGYLLIAVIQGLLMGFGLYFFNVPNAALWGVVAAIGSLIPTVGTALVSIPSVIFLLATNQIGNAIGLGIWAFLIVGWVDNMLNPIIISSKIDIPQILVLFSVLGGLAMLGPVGFLIGPLAISLLYTLLSIYKDEFQQ